MAEKALLLDPNRQNALADGPTHACSANTSGAGQSHWDETVLPGA